MNKNSQRTKKNSVTSKTVDNKAEAIRYIKCAIDALGAEVKSGNKDIKASIADLSVILFDLK